MTPAQLLKIAFSLIATNGSARNAGPDVDENRSGTQALALYQDIQVCVALNDVVREAELLAKAENYYGHPRFTYGDAI